MTDSELITKQNLRVGSIDLFPQRANLYPLSIDSFPKKLFMLKRKEGNKIKEDIFFEEKEDSETVAPTPKNIRRALRQAFLSGLKNANLPVHSRSLNVINRANNFAPQTAQHALQIYSSFDWRIISFGEKFYLCLDHRLMIRSILTLNSLQKAFPSLALNPSQRLFFKQDNEWQEGNFIETDGNNTQLVSLSESKLNISDSDILPVLTKAQIMQIAPSLKLNPSELEKTIKRYSFLTNANAPLARLDACNQFACHLTYNAFPITAGNSVIELNPEAVTLRSPEFIVEKNLIEPQVSFDHIDQTKRAKIILKGLVQFGAYEKGVTKVRLGLLATQEIKVFIERLINRLNEGSVNYPGAEKTFGGKILLEEDRKIICKNIGEYEEALTQFIRTEAKSETDVFLVYLPKEGNLSNIQHPYYKIKSFLLKEGLTSQMVDRKTVLSPDWRDLNLALNLFVKAGNTPWVLEEAIPDVDLFIGLSSSQRTIRGNNIRLIGYVNVFDSYGRWKFYQGDSQAFPFDERLLHYRALIKNSIAAYQAENSSSIKSVHIHLTKKFSKDERNTLSNAVREVAPRASVTFISINHNHPVRLYDLTEGRNGSIDRATYLVDEPNRVYLATTGNNVFNAKGMGTPVPLELTVWNDPENNSLPLKTIAQHILSLTRLNWASSQSFCREPITTKFANDIAKKMSVFMDDPSFFVNPNLRNVPWFI